MNKRNLQTKRALCFVLLVLLLCAEGMTKALAQTQGALNGVFTINDSGDKVRFSRGNLQYQASTSTWRFATNQYDYVGTDNENISATYGGWIDLFGWGTSGYHNPYDNYNTQYQPYSISYGQVNTSCNTYGYGPSTNMQDSNLTGTSAEYDWGVHNAISNGGNEAGLWRTLTKDEWNYIFKTRTTSTVGGTANARFVMSQVNGVNGLILFPDNYTHPSYLPTPLQINSASANFNVNSFTGDGWTAMENLGCVFLPAAGFRKGASTQFQYRSGSSYYTPTCGTYGLYWSASYSDVTYSYNVGFKSGTLYYCDYTNIPIYSTNSTYNRTYGRFGGYSVRLVCEVGPTVYNIGISVNPTEGGMVSGGGEYDEGTTCTLTATPNPGYTFTNWTENGTVVTTNTSYIFTVTGDRNLVANFSQNSYNIFASVNPINTGMITGTGSYNYGATCTLTATANEGYTFTNWTENGSVVSTSAEYSFGVTGSRTLVANFSLNSYFIAVSANPSNGGSVTGSGTYNHGATATLTATANDNYIFSNWTENGNVVSMDANYSFIVTGVRSFVANFTSTLVTYSVTATANPTAGGTVSGAGTYEEGATCTLTATANTGYTFTNWTENNYVVSTNPNCSFTVTGNRSLVANFTLNTYYIAILANPTAGGTVTGAGNYNYGATASLTATANNGYTFTNWTENGNVVSTSASYNFTVTGIRSLVANFTLNTYAISAMANPEVGGTITGMDTYTYGETATLTATANEGYTFANWMENGTIVSTNTSYSFEVICNRSLVANFSPNIYTVSVSGSPTNGGTAAGGGTYAYGTTCTITAVANAEYTFINWTENGTEVSTNAAYTFIVSANRNLVANFSYVGIDGMLNGVFSVSANTQVYFSQGNLQYKASTDTWRFATNQYDYVGEDNANISQTYDGWIDLFGWGTSGYDHGAVCYQPWSTSIDTSDYYAYGNETANLYDQTGQADWGYNPISNGGNQTNQWRTPTKSEWGYLLFSRNTPSGIRYAKAQVNGINGLILVPDNWSTTIYTLNDTNDSHVSFNCNMISLSQWTILENAGAVFLPAVDHHRKGTSVYHPARSYYWSASYRSSASAYTLIFYDDAIGTGVFYYRFYGFSVRLVRTAPSIVSYTINATSSPVEGGLVNGAGNYAAGNNCTLTATTNEGYTFVNWTENGTVVSTNANYTFTVNANRNLVANFSLNEYEIHVTPNPEVGGTVRSNWSIMEGFEGGSLPEGWTCEGTGNWTVGTGDYQSNIGAYSGTYNARRTHKTNGSSTYLVSPMMDDMAGMTNGSLSFAYINRIWQNDIDSFGVYYRVNGGAWNELFYTEEAHNTWTEQTIALQGLADGYQIGFLMVDGYGYGVGLDEIVISAFANGGGVYQYGETCFLTATANTGYTFDSWVENGQVVSTNSTYSFVVTGNRTLDAVFTLNSYEITATTTPANGGTITGAGTYSHGQTCTLTATANEGYTFTNWTKEGTVVSTNPNYSFTVTENAAFVANFTEIQVINCTIVASANPSVGGTVSGAGNYISGQTCTLTATANEGYTFGSWSENGVTVSTDATYSFTVSGSRTLVANFAAAGNYWIPENTGSYSLTMALTGIIQIDGVEQYSDQLEVGAFCGTECRGAQMASEFFLTNRYLVMLSIAGEIGDVLTFKLYDHGLAQELNLTSPDPVTFNADGYGTPIEPYVLNFISAFEISATVDPEGAGTITGMGSYNGGATCTLIAEANAGFQFENWTLDGTVVSTNATYEFTVTQEASYVAHFQYVQTQALSSGWNWYSTYINQDGINGLAMLENSLGSNGVRIQSKSNGYVDQFEYNGTSYWYGTLNAITNEQMYMVRTNAACNATMTGHVDTFTNFPITINNGWNWIGFPGNEDVSVNTALSGFTPEANDQIKSKNNGYSTYIVYGSNALWYGTLNTLESGQGYMYKSNGSESKTLIYHNGRGETHVENVTADGNTFLPEEADYAFNMTITAVIELDGNELRSEDYELAAFAGNECRGSVKLMYVEPLNRYIAFLLVSGEVEESLQFVLTDGNSAIWSDDHMMYSNNGIIGTPIEPAILHFGTLGMDENGQGKLTVYPNPSKNVFNIEGDNICKVEVINAYGQIIYAKEIKGNSIQIDLGNFASGVYMLRVVTNKGIMTQQIIKK